MRWSIALTLIATGAAADSYSIQLNGPLPMVAPAEVFAVDLADTPADTIARYQEQGATVICYFSAGSYEDWRADSPDFPRSVIGESMAGWPGEYWLDVRDLGSLMPIMERRIALAAEKGCDGVDPDNMDVHTQNSGFDVLPDDQIRYARALSGIAHEYGLTIGLKNDLGQVPELVGDFDFATNESCLTYNECDVLQAFSKVGKPVYIIEYELDFDQACEAQSRFPFLFTVGPVDLATATAPCP